MMKLLQEGELNTVNVILKADTNGSVEAIKDGINKLATDDVNIQVVHSAVGGIVLSDVDLASATESLIIGFNVRPDSQARNCLLYTSPSPRDQRGSRMPSSA